MDVTPYIQPAIERFRDANDISDDEFADFLKFTQDDKDAMHALMGLLFTNKWLLLTPEVVKPMITTISKDNVRRLINEKIRAKYQYGCDYVQISRNGTTLDENGEETTKYNIKYDKPNLAGSSARKFYLISPRCIQLLIMDARTPLGEMARRCSAQLNLLHTVKEEFMKCMKERAIRVQIEELTRRAICAEETSAQLRATIRAQKPIAQEWVYIATSPSLAAKNYFKFGRTESLRVRLSSYNGSHPTTDKVYFAHAQRCAFAKQVEQLIKIATAQFADAGNVDKEMRQIPFDALKCIVCAFADADATALATICDSIEHFDANAARDIPEPCDIEQLEPRPNAIAAPSEEEQIANCAAQIFAQIRIDTSYNIKSTEAAKCKDIITQNRIVMRALSLRANMTITTLIDRVIKSSDYSIKIATITIKNGEGRSEKETTFAIQRKQA